jgi:hypothetical protein
VEDWRSVASSSAGRGGSSKSKGGKGKRVQRFWFHINRGTTLLLISLLSIWLMIIAGNFVRIFMARYYAPFLMKNPVRALVVAAWAAFLVRQRQLRICNVVFVKELS